MKWIRDSSGRFGERPYYESDELDCECEAVVTSFLSARHGVVAYPIRTNDLTVLVEQEASDLDLFADLSQEGVGIEGVTDFLSTGKPRVRIARELSEQQARENRLRTTLAHELGHIKFHSFLWAYGQMSLFGGLVYEHSPRCRRETIFAVGRSDWMEWQAGYACGGFLMPITPLRRTVREVVEETDLQGPVSLTDSKGIALVHRVQAAFQVSEDAARVRLLQLRYLSERDVPRLPLIPYRD